MNDDQGENVSIFEMLSEAYENYSENMLVGINNLELIGKLIEVLTDAEAQSLGKATAMLTKIIACFKRNKNWKGLEMFSGQV